MSEPQSGYAQTEPGQCAHTDDESGLRCGYPAWWHGPAPGMQLGHDYVVPPEAAQPAYDTMSGGPPPKSLDPCAFRYSGVAGATCGRSRVAHAQLDHDFVSAEEATAAAGDEPALPKVLACSDVLVHVVDDCYLNPSMITAMVELPASPGQYTGGALTSVYLAGKDKPIVVECGLAELVAALDTRSTAQPG